MTTDKPIHLPSLSIEGFRGIERLTIPRLGRITLIAGKNSAGKTTVLEAVQVYAARGQVPVLYELLLKREEVFLATEEDGESIREPNWAALFHGRVASGDVCLSIGSFEIEDRLVVGITAVDPSSLNDRELSLIERSYPDAITNDAIYMLKYEFEDKQGQIPIGFRQDEFGTIRSLSQYRNRVLPTRYRRRISSEENTPGIKCEFLGPGLLSNRDIARFWDRVALTDDENHAVDALNLIFAGDVERVAVVGDEQGIGRQGRRVVVKVKAHDRPVPLKSLGDGALRLFGVALAVANCQGGFLLIDEAENGIHHSVQRNYWRMLFHAARSNDVQILATTHSWDCVAGFAQAAVELEEVEGLLVRIDREGNRIQAVPYSEEELSVAAEQGIEVR